MTMPLCRAGSHSHRHPALSRPLIEDAPGLRSTTPTAVIFTLNQDKAKIAALEGKLARKDAIIAEVSEEYVKLKKALGEP